MPNPLLGLGLSAPFLAPVLTVETFPLPAIKHGDYYKSQYYYACNIY